MRGVGITTALRSSVELAYSDVRQVEVWWRMIYDTYVIEHRGSLDVDRLAHRRTPLYRSEESG